MQGLIVTPYDLALRFVGLREVSGSSANPQILTMLRLDEEWPEDDVVPWCSAFINYIAWLLRLPRSKRLRARSWLLVGRPIGLEEAEPGFDVVVMTKGGADQPGPDVIEAPGHVGFFAGTERTKVLVLGGNQDDSVSVKRYAKSRILGLRRLAGVQG